MDVLITTEGDWNMVSINWEMESTGLWGQEKGPFFLLEAWNKMHTLIPDVSLRINNKIALLNQKKILPTAYDYCKFYILNRFSS